MTDNESQELQYAGFWIRVWASIIDYFLVVVITFPMLWAIYGEGYFEWRNDEIQGSMDFLISWVMPEVAIILFWIYRSATPGKMVISLKIVDAYTGKKPSVGQFLGRYLSYFIAVLPLGLGIFWIAFDKKKQGWHDKLAGTVVVRKMNNRPETVVFHGEI